MKILKPPIDCRYIDLTIGNFYKVIDLCEDRRAGITHRNLMLVDVNDRFLTFENKIGVRECYINHNNIVRITEAKGW